MVGNIQTLIIIMAGKVSETLNRMSQNKQKLQLDREYVVSIDNLQQISTLLT